MISLTSLLGDFDSLRQEREPLQPHAAIMLDEPKKKQYAALVVMFMLAGGEVNAKQERLLGLWLKALSLNASLADVLECAQQMNMDALRNAIAVIEQHDLVEHCLVDILVFIRIGGASSDTITALLAEWVTLLKISKEKVSDAVIFASRILGATDMPAFSLEFCPTQYGVWLEFFATPITQADLENGIEGGAWLVTSDITVEKEVTINNAELWFVGNTTLAFNGAGNTLIKKTLLRRPLVTVSHPNLVLILEDSSVEGVYQHNMLVTAVLVKAADRFVSRRCHYQTVDARTYYFGTEVPFEFEGGSFSCCGNKAKNGGAIASRTGTNITNKLSGVKFKNCVANIGAVIYMHYAAEKTFYQCEIINCHSEMEFGNNNAGAIYLVDVENKFMNASTVINSNISLFDTYRHSRATFIVGSLLKQCTIFYSREDDNRNKYISEKTELKSGITNQQIKKHSSYLTKSLSF
jgi:hypothetical protein